MEYLGAGDSTSTPPGPSLLIRLRAGDLVFLPAPTMCTASMGAIVDEMATAVPDSDKTFAFSTAPFKLIEIDTGNNGPSTTDLTGNATHVFAFNASLDDSSVDATDFQILDSRRIPVTATIQHFNDDWVLDNDANTIELNDGAYVRVIPYLVPGAYTARVTPDAEIKEVNGGSLIAAAGDLSQPFTVAYGQISSVPRNGAGVPVGMPPTVPPSLFAHPAGFDLSILFNGPIDPTTVSTAVVSLKDSANADVPFQLSVGSGSNSDRIIVNPTSDLIP